MIASAVLQPYDRLGVTAEALQDACIEIVPGEHVGRQVRPHAE